MADLVDFSLFPLVRIHLPAQMSPEVVEQMYRDLEGLLERPGQRYVTLVDTRRVDHMPDALTRRAISEGGGKIEAHTLEHSLGTVLVINSALVRGAHTALSWLRHNPLPEVAVSTMAEALQWCRGQLEGAGAMSGPLRRYLDGVE